MIKIISWNSEEYWTGIDLRNKLLKTSAGKETIKELPLTEKKDTHIAAISGGNVVGILILSKTSETMARIKQVVIDENYQKSGLGKKLLEFTEIVAELMHFQTVFLTGRKQAWGFYDCLGYKSMGYAYLDGHVILKKFKKELSTKTNSRNLGIVKHVKRKEMETNG